MESVALSCCRSIGAIFQFPPFELSCSDLFTFICHSVRSDRTERLPSMQAPLWWVFESLFGCHHQQLSRVFTIRKRTYQVCVECGREFEYSWELMHSRQSAMADDNSGAMTVARQVHASTI